MLLKPVTWNIGKNFKLKVERGVSFEEVYERLQKGAFRRVRNHSRNHPGQKMFILFINRRRYGVPFTEYETHIFLETIFRV